MTRVSFCDCVCAAACHMSSFSLFEFHPTKRTSIVTRFFCDFPKRKRNTHTNKKDFCPVRIEFDTPNASAAPTFFPLPFCVCTLLYMAIFFFCSLYSCSLSMTLLGWEGWHYLRRKAFLPSLFIYNSVESFPCGWMKLEIGKRKNTRNFFLQWFLFFFRLLFLFFSGPLATDTIAQ